MIHDTPTHDGADLQRGRPPHTVVSERGDRLDLAVHLRQDIADVMVSCTETGLRVEGRAGPGGRLASADGAGTFSMEIAVPPGFDRTGVVATLEPGLLRLSMPRSAVM